MLQLTPAIAGEPQALGNQTKNTVMCRNLVIFVFTIAAAVYLTQDLVAATEDASPSRSIPEQAKAAQAAAKEPAAKEAGAERVASDLPFQNPIAAKDETTISVYNAGVAEEENVIASRLEGTWQADAALTNHLGGDAVNGHITFANDAEATGRMPRWLVELITAKNKPVYMAGVVELMDRKHDFVLTAKNGAPVIFLFDKDTPDPATAPLSEVLFASPLEVMVAAAKNKDRDLLILRGPTYFTHHYPIGVFSRAGRKDGNESSDARNGKASKADVLAIDLEVAQLDLKLLGLKDN